MAKFIYGMQNILDIKYKLETQAKQAFAVAQEEYQQELHALEELQKRLEAIIEEKRVCQLQRLDLLEVQRLDKGIEGIKGKILLQKDAVYRAMAKRDQAREQLNQVIQERKTHEKLKEHKFQEFLVEINQQEMKEIDELVSYKHNQKEE